jgi:hypothetical protein
MPNWIQRRVTMFIPEHKFHFQRKGYEGFCGQSFECDAQGNVKDPQNSFYLDALTRVGTEYEKPYVHTYEVKHTEPGIIRCEGCNHKVALWGFTNTCECGRDYNMSGSLLAPRSQWGEETGETASDILNHDYEQGDFDVDY